MFIGLSNGPWKTYGILSLSYSSIIAMSILYLGSSLDFLNTLRNSSSSTLSLKSHFGQFSRTDLDDVGLFYPEEMFYLIFFQNPL